MTVKGHLHPYVASSTIGSIAPKADHHNRFGIDSLNAVSGGTHDNRC
jgi:hypothetical protein